MVRVDLPELDLLTPGECRKALMALFVGKWLGGRGNPAADLRIGPTEKRPGATQTVISLFGFLGVPRVQSDCQMPSECQSGRGRLIKRVETTRIC